MPRDTLNDKDAAVVIMMLEWEGSVRSIPPCGGKYTILIYLSIYPSSTIYRGPGHGSSSTISEDQWHSSPDTSSSSSGRTLRRSQVSQEI